MERERPRPPRWPWWGVAGLALAVRLLRLGRFSYWFDEVNQAYAVHAVTWAKFWELVRLDHLQAPLPYLIGRVLLPVAPSDAAQRVAPALFGAAAAAVLGRLVARRAGERAGLLTALLAALAPYQVHYSQEARPYALGMLFLALGLLALDRFLARPGAARLAALYLAVLGAAYAQYIAAAGLAIAGFALLAEDALAGHPSRRRAARRSLLASPAFLAAVAVGYLPWLPEFLRSFRAVPYGTRLPFTAYRVERFATFFGFWRPGVVPSRLAAVPFVAAVIAGALAAWKSGRMRFAVAWPLAGFAVFFALEWLHPAYDSIFHYIPAGMALTILFALGIERLLRARRPAVSRAGAALLAASLLLEALGVRFDLTRGRTDWRPVAAYLREHRRGEPILAGNQFTQWCLAYYLVGPHWLSAGKPGDILPAYGRDSALAPGLWKGGRGCWVVLGSWGVPNPRLARWLRRLPSVHFPGTDEGTDVALAASPPPPDWR